MYVSPCASASTNSYPSTVDETNGKVPQDAADSTSKVENGDVAQDDSDEENEAGEGTTEAGANGGLSMLNRHRICSSALTPSSCEEEEEKA